MKKFILYINIIFIFLLMSSLTVEANDTIFDKSYSFNEIIVILSEEDSKKVINFDQKNFYGLSCDSVDDLTSSFYLDSSVTLKKSFKRILKINLNTNYEEALLYSIEYLDSLNIFDYVCPNYYVSLVSEQNTIIRKRTSIISNSKPYERIYIPEAKEYLSDYVLKNVNVGILDSGVDSSHNDLHNHISDISWTYSTEDSAYIDTYTNGPHGTPIAGIIVATNSSLNKININDNADIVSLKHSYGYNSDDELYEGGVDSIINAINFAVANNVRIINFSSLIFQYEYSIETAFNNYDGLLVLGAGNSGDDLDTDPIYSSFSNLENLIIVGGMTSNYDLCIESISGYDSNYGKNTVDLFAPGFEIYSTSLNNSYDYYSGTSYAAPFVAGVASLILSIEDYCDTSQIYNLSFSGKDLKYIICNSASYCYGLKDYCKYEGFVNALNAIQLALTYNPIIGYDYYNNLYHEVITRNHSFLEEHDWVLSGLSSTFAVNPAPIVLRCSKCNGTSM